MTGWKYLRCLLFFCFLQERQYRWGICRYLHRSWYMGFPWWRAAVCRLLISQFPLFLWHEVFRFLSRRFSEGRLCWLPDLRSGSPVLWDSASDLWRWCRYFSCRLWLRLPLLPDCVAGCWSPYRLRFRLHRLPEGSGSLPEGLPVLSLSRQSLAWSLLHSCPGLQEIHPGLISQVLLLCIAWQPHRHLRWNRSFRVRLPVFFLFWNPAPWQRGLRRWSCHHVDDIYPWYHLRYGHIFDKVCRSGFPVHTYHKVFVSVPALIRHVHPAKLWKW